jgi:pilus assembly protein CpaE
MLEGLARSLAASGRVQVLRELDRYPEEVDLVRLIRAHAPDLLFVSVEMLDEAMRVYRMLERHSFELPMVAVGRSCEPSILLEIMRAGIREFLALPFEQSEVRETLSHLSEICAQRPSTVPFTDQVYCFVPSKQGVGTSTVALNTAISLSRHPNTPTLLIDMDMSQGIIGFLLKLNNSHSIVEAADNALKLDESLWPQLVSRLGAMDVIHSGRYSPEYRIEIANLRVIIEFARRLYKIICIDLSGNLEKYSLDVMQESKRVFLVVTPEIPSLHLAREKLAFFKSLDLSDRVSVLLNRSHKRSLVSAAQIEDLLGVNVLTSLSNDYHGVHRALQAGRAVDQSSELGRQFNQLANVILEKHTGEPEMKRKLIEYFSLLPQRTVAPETK